MPREIPMELKAKALEMLKTTDLNTVSRELNITRRTLRLWANENDIPPMEATTSSGNSDRNLTVRPRSKTLRRLRRKFWLSIMNTGLKQRWNSIQ